MSKWIGAHVWLLDALARLTFNPMKEAWYPVDRSGQPDLHYYRDPVARYVRMYEAYLAGLRDGRARGRRLWSQRTHATWGLIANGALAMEYATSLLRHPEASAREDGAAILGALGGDDGTVDTLVAALQAERDSQACDAIVSTLGHLKSRRAIPALAMLIQDDGVDGDTQWTAVESLGRITRQRFHAQADPVGAARDWLRRQDVRAL